MSPLAVFTIWLLSLMAPSVWLRTRGASAPSLFAMATVTHAVLFGVFIILVTNQTKTGVRTYATENFLDGTNATTMREIPFSFGHVMPVILPTVLFAVFALGLWLLQRWNAPMPRRMPVQLFWALHIAIASVPVAAYLSGPTSPLSGRYTVTTLLVPLVVLGCFIALCTLALIGLMIWSVTLKMRR